MKYVKHRSLREKNMLESRNSFSWGGVIQRVRGDVQHVKRRATAVAPHYSYGKQQQDEILEDPDWV